LKGIEVRARFFCQVGKLKGERFEFGEEATIGRHPGNSIVLSPASLSSCHAKISYDRDAGGYVLEDLGSMNGTRLDGHRVTVSEPLGHLHVITFAGKHDFIFQDLDLCTRRHPPGEGMPSALPSSLFSSARRPRDKTVIETDPAALPMAFDSPSQRGDRAEGEHTQYERNSIPLPVGLGGFARRVPEEKTKLEKIPPAIPASFVNPRKEKKMSPAVDKALSMEAVDNQGDALENLQSHSREEDGVTSFEGPMVEGTVFALELLVKEGSKRVVLHEGANLVGRDPAARIRPENPDISRRHATLTVSEGRVTVRDEGSRNHTFLGGERIEGEMEISPGTQLRFGSAKALLVVETEQQDGGN
jgi:pSer/pThr/pTyr-binding forkhead associated (FHA) protein